jgi:hypothetical protein
MSIQERRTLLSIASAIAIPTVYAVYSLPGLPAGDAYAPEVFRFWGQFFLVLIPVVIVAKILITILFSIIDGILTREAEPDFEDERDKLIEQRAMNGGQYVFGLGFMGAMLALVAGYTPSVMFIVLLATGIGSELFSELVRFTLYRRGF